MCVSYASRLPARAHQKNRLRGLSRISAEEKLKGRYPGIELPENIVQVEAARIAKKSEETARRKMALEIGTLGNLKKRSSNTVHLTAEDRASLQQAQELGKSNPAQPERTGQDNVPHPALPSHHALHSTSRHKHAQTRQIQKHRMLRKLI